MEPLIDNAYKFAARQIDDAQKYRKSLVNQYSIFTRPADVLDADGIARGFGFPEDMPPVPAMKRSIDRAIETEKELTKGLHQAFRNNPLIKVVTDTPGIGVPMVAELLGIIGDPYIRPARYDAVTGELVEPERKRELSELFAYCGMAPHTVKKKGQSCAYSPHAQSVLWNMAEAVQKTPVAKNYYMKTLWSHYKGVYQTRINPETGNPWPWTRVKHATHRKVGREVLKKLYLEAQRIHEGWDESQYVEMQFLTYSPVAKT